jgi:hypothetical protein
MIKGDGLFKENNYSAALEAYQGADSIMHVPTTGYGVAKALAALGRLVEAKKVAQEMASRPAQPDEPQVFTSARAEAAQLAKELAARTPSLQIAFRGIPNDAEVTLSIDGTSYPRSDFAQPREIDPGKHSIVATAGGAKSSSEVVLKESETRTVTLALALTSHEESAGSPKVESAPATTSNRGRTAAWIALGVGAAGLATAGVTGAILLSRDSKIKDNCPEKHCNSEGRDLIDGNKPLVVVNYIGWGVGLVGAGIGTYLLLTNPSQEKPPQAWFDARPVRRGGFVSFARSF